MYGTIKSRVKFSVKEFQWFGSYESRGTPGSKDPVSKGTGVGDRETDSFAIRGSGPDRELYTLAHNAS